MIAISAFWSTFTLLLNSALAAFGAWLAFVLFGALVVLMVVCFFKVAIDALAEGPLARFL